jgi:hypothetical protein
MSKKEDYIHELSSLPSWDAYLLAQSGLPGPRGNLELAYAAAEIGDETRFLGLIAVDKLPDAKDVPGGEYLPFCGVVGLGKYLSVERQDLLRIVRFYANDTRWRLREAAAMALQGWGKKDMKGLLLTMQTWTKGTYYEQRAVAAGLCEPVLLRDPEVVIRVLAMLTEITASMRTVDQRKNDAFLTLRQGLAYCWSVAVAALPEQGKTAMESWIGCSDADIRWVMKENLKKNRLIKMDADWVNRCIQNLK